ncbi:hypothetical protein [Streptomyces sp. NPDC047014]|uniref:hypothetical protein n=1 Tax=Streptomyces sp. NPDC047014 TaxID=3155736 RepID=UPI0033E85138
MTDRESEDGAEEESQPELCDWCGAVVSDSTEWYSVVPDSSAVHSSDPVLDGKRMVVGCSREHLAELVEQYKRRPFVAGELFAGKIARVLEQHPEGLSEEDLVRETGLTAAQIEVGAMWQNLEFLRWRKEFGDDSEPSE